MVTAPAITEGKTISSIPCLERLAVESESSNCSFTDPLLEELSTLQLGNIPVVKLPLPFPPKALTFLGRIGTTRTHLILQ